RRHHRRPPSSRYPRRRSRSRPRRPPRARGSRGCRQGRAGPATHNESANTSWLEHLHITCCGRPLVVTDVFGVAVAEPAGVAVSPATHPAIVGDHTAPVGMPGDRVDQIAELDIDTLGRIVDAVEDLAMAEPTAVV